MSDALLIPADEILRAIPDGSSLFTFDNGLMVVRRKKHEFRPNLLDLDGEELIKATNKLSGSKFNSEWTLRSYVLWIADELKNMGWDEKTAAGDVTIDVGRVIGWSSGNMTTRVRIEISSRCIHAYPVRE